MEHKWNIFFKWFSDQHSNYYFLVARRKGSGRTGGSEIWIGILKKLKKEKEKIKKETNI